jgi:hypothetical protein
MNIKNYLGLSYIFMEATEVQLRLATVHYRLLSLRSYQLLLQYGHIKGKKVWVGILLTFIFNFNFEMHTKFSVA